MILLTFYFLLAVAEWLCSDGEGGFRQLLLHAKTSVCLHAEVMPAHSHHCAGVLATCPGPS